MRGWLVVLAALSSVGCAASQKAAAKDPMHCERDPKCADHRPPDCTTQCVDDPACMERCSEVVDQNGAPLGH